MASWRAPWVKSVVSDGAKVEPRRTGAHGRNERRERILLTSALSKVQDHAPGMDNHYLVPVPYCMQLASLVPV